MGEILMRYYKHINEKKGMPGKMALANETKLPSAKAAIEPDSPENIELFKKACEKLTGEAAPNF